MIDTGTGPPLVLIPGIQGRWEWMEPAVRALSARHRVLTFSLGDVESFDDWIEILDAELDRAREPSVVVAGVSFGGLIGLHYAARRPNRVRALVLVSTPGPRYLLDAWSTRFVRYPRLALPLFSLRGLVRLTPEIFVARESWAARVKLAAEYAVRVVRAPVSPARMARQVAAWRAADLTSDCARVAAPTLVLTGEPRLDRVVRVDRSLEYLNLIPHARHEVLRETGHVGLITAPDRFADAIDRFLAHGAGAPAGDGDRARQPQPAQHAS